MHLKLIRPLTSVPLMSKILSHTFPGARERLKARGFPILAEIFVQGGKRSPVQSKIAQRRGVWVENATGKW